MARPIKNTRNVQSPPVRLTPEPTPRIGKVPAYRVAEDRQTVAKAPPKGPVSAKGPKTSRGGID